MTRPQQKPNTLLRKARRSAGLTQGQLAERIGVSEKTVQRWEAGKAIPQPIALHALCEELGKTPEELGFGDLEEAPPEEEEQPALQQTEQIENSEELGFGDPEEAPPEEEEEQCSEKQRRSTFPLQLPLMKRTFPPPRQRNLMIGIITILVVAILIGRVAMAAFSHTPILVQSDCGQSFSGMFHGRQLDARWHWDNPIKHAVWSLDSQCSLSITAPAGSDLNTTPGHGHNLLAPRLLQSITGDFTIQTHLQFHPTKNFQSAGLLFWQDSRTFLRFERFSGKQLFNGILFQEAKDNDFHDVSPLSDHPTSAQSLDLRVQKQGDHVTASWREPGHAWQTVGTTELHFDRLMVGLDVLSVYGASQTTATFTSFIVSRA